MPLSAQDETASHGPDSTAASVQNAVQAFAQGTDGRQGSDCTLANRPGDTEVTWKQQQKRVRQHIAPSCDYQLKVHRSREL